MDPDLIRQSELGMLKKFVKSAFHAVGLNLTRHPGKLPSNLVEFSEDEKQLLHHVRRYELTMVPIEGLFATVKACRYVVERGIDGDFVECGVWRGGNSILAAGVFKQLNSDKHIYLFDTFAGMTEPTSEDINFLGRPARLKFEKSQKDDHNEWAYASLDDVRANFEQAGLLDDGVKFIQGDVQQTLKDQALIPKCISVLRLDTDWYESTKLEMEILYPRLSVGGILIVDDYGVWGGSKKAVDEYFAKNGRCPFLHYTNSGGRVAVRRE